MGNSVTLLTYGNEDIEKNMHYNEFRGRLKDLVFVSRRYTYADIFTRLFKYCSIRQVYSRKLSRKLRCMLSGNAYDIVIIDHLAIYAVVKDNLEFIDRNRTILIFMDHNVEFLNYKEGIGFEKGLYRKIRATSLNRGVKSLEKEAIANCDYLWSISEKDLSALLGLAQPKIGKRVIPVYFKWDRVKSEASLTRNTYVLLLLGSMGWYPNIEGALHFIDNIFPKILERDRRYKLYVVGDNPANKLREKRSQNIIVTGRVDCVDPYFDMADMLVVPSRTGSGVKIKILEAIMKGLPVITYHENIEGYPEILFENGFCVANEGDFVESILKINENGILKQKFVREGRKLLEENSKLDGLDDLLAKN